MPTIYFLLFLRLNGSVNGLKPRIYSIALHYYVTMEILYVLTKAFKTAM